MILAILFDPTLLKDIICVALSVAITSRIDPLMLSGYNFISTSFGISAMAVFAIYFKIKKFVYTSIFSLSKGAILILGYTLEKQNKNHFKETLEILKIAALIIM